ncbi:hypothetical protein [Hymenobacter weizhouensis]|uniref:hypothetical protein n=1 Tax=Hymenobacter sp. YIM 151500-1 TaxID=2987689 RepID=UPI002227A3C5|nr:hypothetical protein [Hymenobacter sp. YIM 151500-1]UYZ63499.1 hypothetical protein OIS53_01340 [Hymenobacter sp. YIM 151500-1]
MPLSILVVLSSWFVMGQLPRLLPAVLLKLLTFPPVIYLTSKFRPNQYWLYRNLHLSPRQLWAGVVLADTALLGGLLALLHALSRL